MRIGFIVLLIFLLAGCNNISNSNKEKVEGGAKQNEVTDVVNKLKVSFTFDDGITKDILHYSFEEWNAKILYALEEEGVNSIFFVTGFNKKDRKGKYLLNSWTEKGHKIANHTYSHPNFNNKNITVADFEQELLDTDKIISGYRGYLKLFRFPYLKEGNTEEKVNGFRNVLKDNNYKNGYVTIDASDWYIDSELIKSIRNNGIDNPKVEKYREFYLQHILERSNYYENLSHQLTGRNINHTLLLHHNLTSALFLGDLIERYKEEGWEIIDATTAFRDEVFDSIPKIVPAGESIIWSLAKESGQYENELRYPAEDSRYEIPKMKKLGI